MGSCQSDTSPEDKAARDRNKRIEAETEQLQKSLDRAKRVLLLGTGESGKSTLFRQSRLLYGKGFDKKELETFKIIITANIIDGMRELVRNTESGLLEEIQDSRDFFMKLDEYDIVEKIDSEISKHVQKLWNHSAIQDTYKERSKRRIIVQDNVRYFFNKISEIEKPDYIPVDQDIFCLRQATTGVVQLPLNYGDKEIILLDVGGQRNERKKWIHQFDRCRAILFVTAISEFDQVIAEDQESNRLQESLDLFQEICNLPFFSKTHLILFLNKRDILKEKIDLGIDPRKVCQNLFKDYTGDLDYDQVVEYIVELFAQRNANEERNCYCHITCATDPQNIKKVFNVVYDIILSDALGDVM
jgi:GTPase SAR1 family protein